MPVEIKGAVTALAASAALTARIVHDRRGCVADDGLRNVVFLWLPNALPSIDEPRSDLCKT